MIVKVKVKNKDTESVVSALIKQSKKLPNELYKSLTWDRGKELADHKVLRWKQISMYTFVTQAVHGSVALTKTLTVYLDNTSQKGQTCHYTRKRN